MKAVQDQRAPPLETKLSYRWTEAPPEAIGRAQLISKALEREVPISHYQSAGTCMRKGTTARPKPQTWLFPGPAQTCEQSIRAWAPALAHSCLSSVLWPQPGHPALTQARSGHSVRVSRGQQSPCVQAGSWTPAKRARWCGRQKRSLPFTGQQFICTDIATSLKYK